MSDFLAKTMIWLAAAATPLAGLPGGSCLCGNPSDAKSYQHGQAMRRLPPGCACCHAKSASCCHGRKGGSQTPVAAVCQCNHGESSKPAVPPIGHGPTLKQVLSPFVDAAAGSAVVDSPLTQAVGSCLVDVSAGTSLERLSNLCRLTI